MPKISWQRYTAFPDHEQISGAQIKNSAPGQDEVRRRKREQGRGLGVDFCLQDILGRQDNDGDLKIKDSWRMQVDEEPLELVTRKSEERGKRL